MPPLCWHGAFCFDSFNPNRALGFFVFVKLLKINDKGKEKPKIFSYCDLMTDWGLISCLLALEYIDFELGKGSVAFGFGTFNIVASGEYHRHATMARHFGFAKNAQLHPFLFQCLVHIFKFHTVAVAFNHNGFACRWAIEPDGGNGQAHESASMQGKLALVL